MRQWMERAPLMLWSLVVQILHIYTRDIVIGKNADVFQSIAQNMLFFE